MFELFLDNFLTKNSIRVSKDLILTRVKRATLSRTKKIILTRLKKKKKFRRHAKKHNELKENIQKDFVNDVIKSQETNSRKVLTFDLQKVLVTPARSTNVAFYKRHLARYNGSTYDEGDRKSKYQIIIHTVIGVVFATTNNGTNDCTRYSIIFP